MAKQDPFTAHVAKARKGAATDAIAAALGALVKAKLRRPVRTIPAAPARLPATYVPSPKQRRSPRRLGRIRFYTATTKPDVSRYGTFRRYMITTIRAHTDTRSANAAHALCDNSSFAKNKLDFNWAADNGFITFD